MRGEQGKHMDSRNMQHGLHSMSWEGCKGFPKIRCLSLYLNRSKFPRRRSSCSPPFCRCSVWKPCCLAPFEEKRGHSRGKEKAVLPGVMGGWGLRSHSKVKQKAAELHGVSKRISNGGSVLTELQGQGVCWVKHVFGVVAMPVCALSLHCPTAVLATSAFVKWCWGWWKQMILTSLSSHFQEKPSLMLTGYKHYESNFHVLLFARWVISSSWQRWISGTPREGGQ